MTPKELLEEVKGRFIVLYHNNDAALERLLRQAMGKYQDKAGVILHTHYDAGTTKAKLPNNCLSVVLCVDANERFIPVDVDEIEGEVCFIPKDSTSSLTLMWLARLRDWPLDKDLPHGCVSLLGDYLEALIDIPNTQRTRDAYHDINGPLQDLPSQQDLKARVAELELQMEECRAIIPPVLITY